MLEWKPSEGIDDTDELMGIIECDKSVAVLAGAGAGKTELLAQKASYLFHTEKCSWPKRILSLTFKTEAQNNIKERVNKRCGSKANRFDSFTFHAFCKSIVDRFKNVLPLDKRPINNYDIVFRPKDAYGVNKILMDDLLSLAIDILSQRKDICNLFSTTYNYVFVDEFQDTTHLQYKVLQTLFQNTTAKILSVGDINQSIMLWAKARPTVFQDFENDFGAKTKFLLENYRASQEVQDVLSVFLQFIKSDGQPITSLNSRASNCNILSFENEYQESAYIIDKIKGMIASGIKESDICVLTKQHSSQYSEILRSELSRANINNLDMSDLRDILKEPIGKLFSLFFKIFVAPTPRLISELCELNLVLNKIDYGDEKESECLEKLLNFIASKRGLITKDTLPEQVLEHLKNSFHFLGTNKIRGRWKQYKSPEFYNLVWQALEVHFRNMCSQANSLQEAALLFNAENAIQVMNIHKCKGLEYKVVIFIGLEDQAFYKYKQEPFENNCAIYVALSRAKEQIFVTCTRRREHRMNFGYDNRDSTFNNIRNVIDLLVQKCNFQTFRNL
jgi:DNA helicase-2/ATP-dependent DNA helicase PcrA